MVHRMRESKNRPRVLEKIQPRSVKCRNNNSVSGNTAMPVISMMAHQVITGSIASPYKKESMRIINLLRPVCKCGDASW